MYNESGVLQEFRIRGHDIRVIGEVVKGSPTIGMY